MTTLTTPQNPFLIDDSNNVFIPRILLVDSESHHLSSILAIFNQYQTKTMVAVNGLDALRLLKKDQFDLILLDLDLPDLDGYTLMDFIQKQKFNTDIIVLSGINEKNAAIHAYSRGAYSFLKKPYAPEELLHKVCNALSKRLLEAKNRSISQQLQHSEQLYHNLVDNAPGIIFTLNEHGQITFINKSVTPILGYQPDELTLQHYSTLIYENDREQAQSAFDHRNESTVQVELRLHGKEKPHPTPFALTLMNLQFSIQGGSPIKGTYVIARDLSDNKRVEEVISFHTHYDTLTKLPNRILLNKKLDFELQHAKNHQIGLTLFFIDLDNFKLINDTLGYAKGDLLLEQVASRLQKTARYSDIAARLGSDEFILAMPGLSEPQQIQDTAKRCLEIINAPFDIAENETLTISASIGVAIYPEDGQTAKELISNADIAMSQIKSHGKDGIVFYNHTMAKAFHTKLSHDRALRRALERNELEMYYQPQIDLTTGKLIGAEALMRWHHPEHGLLAAGEFLPFAEESSLILPMTDWMLEAVCDDIHICQTFKRQAIPFSINLSPRYLDRRNFPKKIQESLDRHSISSQLLQVEITENISIRNPTNAIAQLNEISDIGIDIAVDDFGTGYSSLAYLHRFPIQTIKIDRAFVSKINDSEGDFPIVRAIISIAQGLGMTLIAEGVETEIQAQYLQQRGCNIMQGYLYYKPMPLKQLLELLT